jgi:hypothetical protein
MGVSLFRTTAAGLLSNPASFKQQIAHRFEEVMLRSPAKASGGVGGLWGVKCWSSTGFRSPRSASTRC